MLLVVAVVQPLLVAACHKGKATQGPEQVMKTKLLKQLGHHGGQYTTVLGANPARLGGT